MIILDYGTLLHPATINLSIGSIKKPTLEDIYQLGFDKFNLYEFFLKTNPEEFVSKFNELLINDISNFCSQEEIKHLTLYRLIKESKQIQEIYTEILNFFFIENVVFKEGMFVIFSDSNNDEMTSENIKGVISEESFATLLGILQQICHIYTHEEKAENLKFKNKLAKKLYAKITTAQKKQSKNKEGSKDLTLPNVISSVCARHPSLNYTNIWSLTVFQLIDTFNKLISNEVYNIQSTRVSVWGDEKKVFNSTLWYKNQYEV